ncbi:MAG: hypothetical protein EBZ95_14580 [Chitinophagia bacterium]|nr:hypothetical protein [Chitinophagia bacterium]
MCAYQLCERTRTHPLPKNSTQAIERSRRRNQLIAAVWFLQFLPLANTTLSDAELSTVSQQFLVDLLVKIVEKSFR